MKQASSRRCWNAATILELRLDGLIGITHNAAGLSIGNIASMGVPQAVMPPHCQPELDILLLLGFGSDDENVPERPRRKDTNLRGIGLGVSISCLIGKQIGPDPVRGVKWPPLVPESEGVNQPNTGA